MADYFTGQLLTIKVKQLDFDLSQAVVKRILYQKPAPDNTVGFWNATATSNNRELYYDTGAGDIDKAGTWAFQAYVETAAGKKGYGQLFTIKFITPIL